MDIKAHTVFCVTNTPALIHMQGEHTWKIVQIFTSRVSGRGNIIGPVCVCVCVCVCLSALSWLNCLTYDLDFLHGG